MVVEKAEAHSDGHQPVDNFALMSTHELEHQKAAFLATAVNRLDASRPTTRTLREPTTSRHLDSMRSLSCRTHLPWTGIRDD
jgi:hypothetical protein